MKEYADLLCEQIRLYGADIILCCGGQGIMVDFIKENLYTDLEQVNGHCWYSAEANVLVVKQYHPNYNVYTRKDMYASLMRDYQSFLKTNPRFPSAR